MDIAILKIYKLGMLYLDMKHSLKNVIETLLLLCSLRSFASCFLKVSLSHQDVAFSNSALLATALMKGELPRMKRKDASFCF